MAIPKNVERLKDYFYQSRSDWVDGTQRYVTLLKEFIREGSYVLDVGPGSGNGFQHGNYFQDCYVVGVDPDPEIKENRTLREAVVAAVENLPFPDNKFDAVVCNYALEHINNPGLAAAEIYRVLKPKGVFGFRTPNLGHYVAFLSWITPQCFHNLVANRVRGMKNHHDPWPTLYRCNTRRAIKRHFGKAGFHAEVLCNIEAEPSYLQFCSLAFLMGVAYERLVNCCSLGETFRANIIGVLRKNG